MAKNIYSNYAINGKDGSWLKIMEISAVIGGFTLGVDGVVNAVLAGLFRNEEFIFIGKVGTGKLRESDWRLLTEALRKIRVLKTPFSNNHPDMCGHIGLGPY